jgi:hypothetical protein
VKIEKRKQFPRLGDENRNKSQKKAMAMQSVTVLFFWDLAK